MSNPLQIKNTFQSFFNVYWLRPENAVWRSIDSIYFSKIKFQKPFLDLGCGDGIFSFINLGGKFDDSYDVFRNIKETNSFDKGADIYDQNTFVDPKILKKPKISIDVGIDHKENLLKRASSLKIYNKLIKSDVSKKTPFKENEFETVFSNIVYWLNGDIFKIINELKRISNDRIIICVPNTNFKKSLIYNNYLKNKNNYWAKFLDRGIYSNITKHCYSNSKWEEIFTKSNLKIEKHFKYLSQDFVKLWGIGLRPFSPYFIEMANSISLKERTKIKKRTVNELSPMFISYIQKELRSKKDNLCFNMYELKVK